MRCAEVGLAITARSMSEHGGVLQTPSSKGAVPPVGSRYCAGQGPASGDVKLYDNRGTPANRADDVELDTPAISGLTYTSATTSPLASLAGDHCEEARRSATCSRTCGATSSMKVASVCGSASATRTNVPKPSSVAKRVRTSPQCWDGPTAAWSASALASCS